MLVGSDSVKAEMGTDRGKKTTYEGVDVTALSGARGFEHIRLSLPFVFSAR